MMASLQQARTLYKPAMGLTGVIYAGGLQLKAGRRLKRRALRLQCASWHIVLSQTTHSSAEKCTTNLPIVQVPQEISCKRCLQWVS